MNKCKVRRPDLALLVRVGYGCKSPKSGVSRVLSGEPATLTWSEGSQVVRGQCFLQSSDTIQSTEYGVLHTLCLIQESAQGSQWQRS